MTLSATASAGAASTGVTVATAATLLGVSERHGWRLLARYPRLAAAGDAERDRRVRFRGLRQLPVRLG